MINETLHFVIPSTLIPDLFKAFKKAEKNKKFKVVMNLNTWPTEGRLFEFEMRFREFTEGTMEAGVIAELKAWFDAHAVVRDDDVPCVPFTISPVPHSVDTDVSV